MQSQAIQEAVDLLLGARRSGVLLDSLPASCAPATVSAAHAIQDAAVAALGDTVAGWKVSAAPDGSLIRGPLLRSRVSASPARVAASLVPLLGVEAEIAFRFERELPTRNLEYSYAEVADAVTALAAIEVVDSRFKSYQDTPLLHRLADCMSNGFFVQGVPQRQWREIDLANLHVALAIDGTVVVEHTGGHPTRDPLLPAVALVNYLGTRGGVPAGLLMTTGTYTGLSFAKPGQAVTATFDGFGSAQVVFET